MAGLGTAEIVVYGISISKPRFLLGVVTLIVLSLLAPTPVSSDIKVHTLNEILDGFYDGSSDDNTQGKSEKNDNTSNKFLRKRMSARIDNGSTTRLSGHERKLRSGARIAALYNSNRGHQLIQKCASETLWEHDNIPEERSPDDAEANDADDIEGSIESLRKEDTVTAVEDPIEDHRNGGYVTFLSDEECMLFLKRQKKRDIVWVDYDHPTKLFDSVSSVRTAKGKPYNELHRGNNTQTEIERKLQEHFSEWAMSLIQADEVEKGDRNTKVCIVDTGINPSDPVFDGISIQGENSRWNWEKDNNGHGTRVAGIIAGFQHLLRGSGDIEFYITRASDDDGFGYEIDLYIAIEQCMYAGVDVINVSNGSVGLSMLNDDLYNRVVNKHGILLIAAAGNDGDGTKHYPAAHPAAIAVTSVDRDGDISSFSNRGNWVELSAPGARIVGPTSDSDYSYSQASGTSFAVPFVTGAAAILRTYYEPGLCPSEALRYALAINAVVPGAPITGIHGDNMKPLNPYLNIAMEDDAIDQFFGSGNSDRDIEGKCSERYGNGLIKTRDTLEWLSFYDCFSTVLFAVQDAGEVIASQTEESPNDCLTKETVNSNRDDDWAPRDENRWVPRNRNFSNEGNTEEENNVRNKKKRVGNGSDDERWGPLFHLDDYYGFNGIRDGSNTDGIHKKCESGTYVDVTKYLNTLRQMLPWKDPRVGSCYSG